MLDEEDRTITAGAIVTVTVKLERKDMGVGELLPLVNNLEDTMGEVEGVEGGEGEEENEEEEAEEGENQVR